MGPEAAGASEVRVKWALPVSKPHRKQKNCSAPKEIIISKKRVDASYNELENPVNLQHLMAPPADG